MSNLAIITARGGSKRIPRKNIKEFCGKAIIEYAINAALQSNIFDEVMVSTDDDEIAKISKKAGANIPFMRSSDTSNDYATTADVISEVLDCYKSKGQMFDYFCCIYPTAPFITPQKLQDAYSLLISKQADSAIPVVRFSYPPQRCFIMDNDKISYKYPEYVSARSQDLKALYHDCGQFYFMRAESFMKEKCLVTSNTVPMILSEMEVQDIDSEEDWEMAEIKYKFLQDRMQI